MDFVGCDVGASSSTAVCVSSNGKIKCSEHGPAANPHVVGFDSSVRAIAALLNRTMRNATNIHGIAVCISGMESVKMRELYEKRLTEALDLPTKFQVAITHDAVAPLGFIISNQALEQQMAVLIAGTGSVAALFQVGQTSGANVVLQGKKGAISLVRRAGGWGPILGDAGSAWWIVQRSLGIALRLRDGMEVVGLDERESLGWAEEVLQKAMDHYCGLGRFEELIAFMNNRDTSRGKVASLAPILANLAKQGNGLCREVFEEAGMEIGELLWALRATELGKVTTICATGGVFAAWDDLPEFQRGFQAVVGRYSKDGLRLKMLTYDKDVNNSVCMAVACARLLAFVNGSATDEWNEQVQTWLRDVPNETEE